MKYSLLALSLFEGLVVAACSANNCLRAVRATAYGPATVTSRRADCSSFFSYTVFPTTSTSYFTVSTSTVLTTFVASTETDIITNTEIITTTVSSTFYSVPPAQSAAKKNKRTITTASTQTPSLLPSYANVCAGTSAYSSACSCLGVPSITVTRPTPITVITVTATTTSTQTSTATTATTLVVTSTSVVSAVTTLAACPGSIPGGGSCNCNYGTICNADFTPQDLGATRTTTSFGDCLSLCDNNGACGTVSWEVSTGKCQQYHSIFGGAAGTSSGIILAYNLGCSGICNSNYNS
ncbi:hypothetical protein ABW20_dc0109807 [Dactylellina cionopaga]|nr:hypothetical protein ABW20_dc0109807 [Dactylellina cionopaga]